MIGFREASGGPPEWISTGIEHNFSNFRFVDQRFRSSEVLRRIFSLARKLNYQSLVIEEILPKHSEEFTTDCEHLAYRLSSYRESKAYRILFLGCPRNSNPTSDDFLGYAVFQEDYFNGEAGPRHHVYECVMPHSRSAVGNNFIHCAQSFDISSQLGEFQATGVLYAQQNDLTFVCAHVALRSALSCVLPEGDISYSEINQILGIDHVSKQVGDGVGLKPDEIETVLNAKNLHFSKIVHEPDRGLLLPGDYQRDLYGIIESGQPALLGFELDGGHSRHIIPVVGHTFNEDTWVADSSRTYFGKGLEYFPSENWLSTYVVHDDNFGPYYCLPRHYLGMNSFRLMLGLERCPVGLHAVDAEAVGISYLTAIAQILPDTSDGWRARFRAFAESRRLVLRSLLLTKEEYLNHLCSSVCWDGEVTCASIREKAAQILPDWVWVIEASAPELFSASRRKFGEVVLRADLPAPRPLNTDLLLLCRIPSSILFFKPDFRYEDSGTLSHVEIFRFSE